MKMKHGDKIGNIPNKDLNAVEDTYVDDFDDKYYQTYLRQEVNLNWIRMLFLILVIMAILIRISVYLVESTQRIESAKSNLGTMDNILVEEQINKIPRVVGDTAISEDWVKLSYRLGEYVSIINTGTEFSRLDELTETGSYLYKKEKEYRDGTKYVGDESDCSARALRNLGKFFKLVKINDVIIADGIYHCYLTVSVPDIDGLWEYYLVYAYDITRYVSVHEFDSETLTSCMVHITENNKLPTVEEEIELQLVKKDGEFYLVTDEYFANKSLETFKTTIAHFVDLLGSKYSADVIV